MNLFFLQAAKQGLTMTSTPANSYSILVQNNETGSNQPLLLLLLLRDTCGVGRTIPPLATIATAATAACCVEQGGCAGAASLSGLPLLTT